eukprot:TRINITY_DN53108_c0_g1_i6.p1 TRINITY_DN53108_c0_g1~~TRINITY_DN53108_c0_g1_i6.p1  ORF type:complete len:266 (-),score=-5.66 TRINITY_DN53108_c0_g1_i6:94-891(-)
MKNILGFLILNIFYRLILSFNWMKYQVNEKYFRFFDTSQFLSVELQDLEFYKCKKVYIFLPWNQIVFEIYGFFIFFRFPFLDLYIPFFPLFEPNHTYNSFINSYVEQSYDTCKRRILLLKKTYRMLFQIQQAIIIVFSDQLFRFNASFYYSFSELSTRIIRIIFFIMNLLALKKQGTARILASRGKNTYLLFLDVGHVGKIKIVILIQNQNTQLFFLDIDHVGKIQIVILIQDQKKGCWLHRQNQNDDLDIEFQEKIDQVILIQN